MSILSPNTWTEYDGLHGVAVFKTEYGDSQFQFQISWSGTTLLDTSILFH